MMTLEEIYQKLAAEFQERTGLAAAGSSELAVRFYAVAAELYSLYVQAEWTRRQCFPQTAVGEDLDNHAWLRGIDRRQAVKATGTVTFFLDKAQETEVEIPEGTVCMTAGGTRFVTLETGTVEAQSVQTDVPVEAGEAGISGNAAANTIVYMAVPPVGVAACANAEPLVNGQDTEDDESLRARVLESYRRLANGANNAFYEQAAMAFDGVAAVTVLPKARGVGTVDLVVASPGGKPEEELIRALQAYFDRVREIAVSVEVKAPAEHTVDVEAAVTPEAGWEFGQVSALAEKAVRDWFTGERLGKPLTRAELIALIYQVDGVANVTLTRPAEDLAAEQSTLPVLGTLTITNAAGE